MTPFLGWLPQFPWECSKSQQTVSMICPGAQTSDGLKVSYSLTCRRTRGALFGKGPDRKILKLSRLYGLYHKYLTLSVWHKSSHRWYINNGQGYVPVKLYLQNKPMARLAMEPSLLTPILDLASPNFLHKNLLAGNQDLDYGGREKSNLIFCLLAKWGTEMSSHDTMSTGLLVLFRIDISRTVRSGLWVLVLAIGDSPY